MPFRLGELADTLAAFGREVAQIDLGSPRARECWKSVVSVFFSLFLSFVLLDLSDSGWAAFSAFMVPRALLGETLKRGFDRVLGTVAGAILGFLLVGLVVNGLPARLMVIMLIGFVSIFQFQVSRHSYAWTFFGLTAEMVLGISLSTPQQATSFVAVRIGEIIVGVLGCVVIACLFEVCWPIEASKAADLPAPRTPIWRGWLDERWLQTHASSLGHAFRGALAFAVLFAIWRILELTTFLDSLVSAFIVLLIPSAQAQQSREATISTRGTQRLVGCSLGGLAALSMLVVAQDSLRLWVLGLGIGVWIGAWVQGSKTVSYAGTQFALALLVTFVQGSGPPESLVPAWLRLQGIFVGVFAISLVQLVWPMPVTQKVAG